MQLAKVGVPFYVTGLAVVGSKRGVQSRDFPRLAGFFRSLAGANLLDRFNLFIMAVIALASVIGSPATTQKYIGSNSNPYKQGNSLDYRVV